MLRVTSFMVIAKFPPRFISAILIGQSFGGIFAAVVQIFTLFIASTSTATAFLYFMIAAIVTLFILAYFLAACKIHFFKFHYELEAPKQKGIRSSLKEICKQIWVPTLALLLDTYITHCIHPSVASIIVSTGSGSGNSWNGKVFQHKLCKQFLFLSTKCLYINFESLFILESLQKTLLSTLYSIFKVTI